MEQIYEFERFAPPILNERKLRAEAARREQRRQTILLTLASILIEVCLAMGAWIVYPHNQKAAVLLAAYCILSVTGMAVIAIVFAYRRQGLVREQRLASC